MKITLLLSIILLLSCNNISTPTNETQPAQQNNLTIEKIPKNLASGFLGIYHGKQSSYFMKNQYGDDMIVNGNKISVPGIDYKFILKEGGITNLQQTSLEDNSRYYYNGNYLIVKEDTSTITIECKMSDGRSSFPSYTLTLDKVTLNGTCKGSNDPEFEIQKTK
jgi:hypothetical protein